MTGTCYNCEQDDKLLCSGCHYCADCCACEDYMLDDEDDGA